MSLLTSGIWKSTTQRGLTGKVYEFMCEKFPQIRGSDVEVNRVDLSEDGVFGWCQLEEELMYKEFLIEIHDVLLDKDYIPTLIHELIHVKQTIDGLLDHDRREEEANIWEKVLSNEFLSASNV